MSVRAWSVSRVEDGKVTKVTGVVVTGREWRRIAEVPGMYTYLVGLGSGVRRITVDIKNGMITPVKVTAIATGGDWTGKTFFNMSLSAESPIPVPVENK